jgi:ATPase subunit of ABC transporter with duplicated ATPase domains
MDYVTNVHGELASAKKQLDEVTDALHRASSRKKSALQQSELMERIEYLGGYDIKSRAEKILSGLGFPSSTPESNQHLEWRWMDHESGTCSNPSF